MEIALVDKEEHPIPEDAIRADIAWDLFLPGLSGDISNQWNTKCSSFKNWLWIELGMKSGYMRSDQTRRITVVCPKMTSAGKELMTRTCSFWADTVIDLIDGKEGGNAWTAPIVNVKDVPGRSAFLGKISGTHHGSFHSLISPLFGCGRSNIRVYTIPVNGTFARFHSHTAREELYLVLRGKGSARIGNRVEPIREGDLISKPTGPDLGTQLLADLGSDLQILDIEIWPDMLKNSKDVVHYSDHGEVMFFGEGWDMIVPSDAFYSAKDGMLNYDSGYRRNRDGSWSEKEVSGFTGRREKKNNMNKKSRKNRT